MISNFFPLFREEFPYIKLHPQWWSHLLRPIGMCLPGCLALCLSALVFGTMIPKDSHRRRRGQPWWSPWEQPQRGALPPSSRGAMGTMALKIGCPPYHPMTCSPMLFVIFPRWQFSWVIPASSDFQTKLCVPVSSYSRLHTGRYL